MTFRDRMEEQRKKHGWTWADWEREAGLNPRHISVILTRAKKRDDFRPDYPTLRALAKAAGVSVEWLNEDDEKSPGTPAESPRVVRDHSPANPDGTPLQRALAHAFDGTRRHLPIDMEKVGEALGTLMRRERLDGDLVDAARKWLDAASAMRREGEPVTSESLLLRATVGKSPAGTAAERHAAEFHSDVAAHVAAFEAGAGDDVDPVDPAAVARLKANAAKK